MNPLTKSKKTIILPLLIPLALGCVVLAPTARAVLPAPDGGYPNANTAEGDNALFSLTTGDNNTAIGSFALYHNTAGRFNTANGSGALVDNVIGSDNTATGAGALTDNTTGNNNTANGSSALFSNSDGNENTANGVYALVLNVSGSENTAIGAFALNMNATGSDNTAIGVGALVGTTANGNIALGAGAGDNLTTGDNNIDIGNEGVAGESSTIRIGAVAAHTNAYIAGIYNTTVAKGVGVVVDSAGHLGTKGSSERFKDAIKPMDKASEAILALKPVTFRYKKELDPEGTPQFGLMAEEVEKVNPDLVARDAEGKVYTVRYDVVNAMLLNEFLKEHRTVQELKSTATRQEATIAQLKSTVAQQQKDFVATTAQHQKEFDSKIAHQQKQIEALTAGLQKVSTQLEASKPSPQMAVNDQ